MRRSIPLCQVKPLDLERLETVTGRVVGTNEATDCEFPSPGVYWFQVLLNEKLVAERRFSVSEAPGDTNGQPIP
jgi:hypothetical protein